MALCLSSLTDKIVLVTGAGRGIGRAVALTMARAGCHVVLAARTRRPLEEVALEIRGYGREAVSVICDVGSKAAVDRLEKTSRRLGTIQILVNSAGIAPAAAWIGVTGSLPPEAILLSSAMAAWVGGFDILYACQDYEFDRLYGVHSIPRRFGIPSAIWVARSMHFFTSTALLVLGIWMDLAFPYYFGWVIGSLLLAYEHFLVTPHDLSKLNKAFFNINSYVALVLLLFTVLAVVP